MEDRENPARSRQRLVVVQVLATFVAWVGASRMGELFQIGDGVSIFFPATAIDVIACMHFGLAGAAGIVLGALATPWQPDETLTQTLISGLLNVAEGMIPWLVFRAFRTLHTDLRDLKSVLHFLLWGAIVNSAISAGIGTAVLIPSPPGETFHSTAAFAWWISDFSAAVILAMPLLAFGHRIFARIKSRGEDSSGRSLVNAVLVTVTVIFLGWLASSVIQHVLSNRVERERLDQQRISEEVGGILTRMEVQIHELRGSARSSSPAAVARGIENLVRDYDSLEVFAASFSPNVRDLYLELGEPLHRLRGDMRTLGTLDRFVVSLRAALETDLELKWQLHAARRAKIVTVSFLMDGMVLLVVLLGSTYLILEVTGPLRKIHNEVALMSAGVPFHSSRIESDLIELQSLARALEETSLALAEHQEELQLEKDRALAASQAKSDFLARMSHELRTPLNSILGFSDLVRDGWATMPESKRSAFLGNIIENGKRLLQMINDLLDISKIEAGKMSFEMKEVDVREVVEESVSLTQSIFENRRQKVVVDLGSNPIVVVGDRDRLAQVFVNLLSNACKFSAEGSRVIARAEVDSGDSVVSIIDEGVGIPVEKHERIFEEFEQIATHERLAVGTGLGLALVRKFVNAHDGRVEVTSEPGVGSTFRVILPLVDG